MRQGSSMVLVPCGARFCQATDVEGVAVAGSASEAEVLSYGRNDAVFEIDAPGPSLLIENELFAPGWTGLCEIH